MYQSLIQKCQGFLRRGIKSFFSSIAGLTVIAFVVRLIILPLTHHGDMENYIIWAQHAYENGFVGFYSIDFTKQLIGNYNYPPLILFVFTLIHGLYLALQEAVWRINLLLPLFPSRLVHYTEQKEILYILYKFPAVICEVGSGVLVYYTVKNLFAKKHITALLSAGVFLFNPALIYNSSLWGQIEAVPVFFLLLSLYLLLYKKMPPWGTAAFVVGLLMKQSLVIFAPIIVLVMLSRFSFKQIFVSGIVAVSVFYISFFPFYKNGNPLLFAPLTYLFKIQFASNSDFVSKNAFNFWWLFSGHSYISDSTRVLLLSLKQWGYLLWVLFSLPVLIYQHKKGGALSVYMSVVCIALFSFFFLTRMHERHLHHAIAVAPLLIHFSKRSIYAYVAASIVHFFNLFAVWGFGIIPWKNPITIFVTYIAALLLLPIYSVIFYETVRGKKAHRSGKQRRRA